jgi:hypothetical protein
LYISGCRWSKEVSAHPGAGGRFFYVWAVGLRFRLFTDAACQSSNPCVVPVGGVPFLTGQKGDGKSRRAVRAAADGDALRRGRESKLTPCGRSNSDSRRPPPRRITVRDAAPRKARSRKLARRLNPASSSGPTSLLQREKDPCLRRDRQEEGTEWAPSPGSSSFLTLLIPPF